MVDFRVLTFFVAPTVAGDFQILIFFFAPTVAEVGYFVFHRCGWLTIPFCFGCFFFISRQKGMNTSVADVADGLWFWTPLLRTIWNSEFSFPADPCISEPFRMFPPPLRACPSFYLPMKNLRVADVSLRSLLYRASHCCGRSLTYGCPELWKNPRC